MQRSVALSAGGVARAGALAVNSGRARRGTPGGAACGAGGVALRFGGRLVIAAPCTLRGGGGAGGGGEH
eukprot:2267128-Prymnesium_polylepis.2